jgi:hypothetical protein
VVTQKVASGFNYDAFIVKPMRPIVEPWPGGNAVNGTIVREIEIILTTPPWNKFQLAVRLD